MAHDKTHWIGLFVGIDDYRDDRLDARGGVKDVESWVATARRWGLADARMVICSSPMLAPEHFDPPLEGAQFIEATGEGWREVMASVFHLSDANTRLLVSWTGHASADPGRDGSSAGPLLAMADYDPASGHGAVPLLQHLGKFRYGPLNDVEVGEDPLIVAFIDACHGSAPATARDGDVTTWSDAGVLAFTASQPGAKAYVMEINGQKRGAFSWAVTTLLQRFGFEGGASRLTPADLYYRTRSMLDLIDASQEPMLFCLTGQFNRRLLGGMGNEVVGAERAELGDPLEIYPGLTGKILQVELQDQVGGRLGDLFVVGSGVSGNGWKADSEYWSWSSGSGFGSTAVFYSVPKGTIEPSSTTPSGTAYARSVLSSGSGGLPKISSGYGIYDPGASLPFGYRVSGSSSVTYYSNARSKAGTLAATNDKRLEWKQVTGVGAQTAGWYSATDNQR